MPPEDREETEVARLREQNAQLNARVAELGQELASAHETVSQLKQNEWRLSRLIELPADSIAVMDKGIIVDVNSSFERIFRCPRADAIGQSALEFTTPESRELVATKIREGATEPYEVVLLRKDGSTFVAQMYGRMIEEDGRTLRVTSARDVTELKRAELVLRDCLVREQVIKGQAAVIAELSTPLLPIAEGVLVLPIVGQVNAERGRQVLDTLTQGVSAHRAAVAILDITGVSSVDTLTADALVAGARAVALLGARLILTGISPAVARTLVELGADLGGITTLGTLGQGVAHALGHLSFAPAPGKKSALRR